MAVIQSPDLTRSAEIDATMKAIRASIRPQEALSWISAAERSGSLTGPAANTALFSFRNLSANPVLVRRVGCGFLTTTAFTAAQEVAFGLKVARAFTASDTAGTALALTGSNAKHRTSLATLSSIDCRICAAANLTAGTKTLDSNNLGIAGGWSGAVGVTVQPSLNNLFAHDPEDYPLVLAQNEGLNIMNLVAFGAAGIGIFYAAIEVAEVSSY